MKEPVFRILSDVHWGHSASLVREAAMLDPLFEGADKVIFNGDTVEMKDIPDLRREELLERVEHLTERVRRAGAEPLLITGNHDPFVPGVDLHREADGKILLTHGDCIFTGLTPWSHDADDLHRHLEAILAGEKNRDGDPAVRLAGAAREAYRRLFRQLHRNRSGSFATLRLYCRQMWPPYRPISILHYWWKTPELALRWVESFAPQTDIFIMGHTHRPGIWKHPRTGRPPLLVCNTGSFMPFLGRLCLDWNGSTLRIRGITAKNGRFYPGREKAVYELD